MTEQYVEQYMAPVRDAIARHLPSGEAQVDIYNRAYEAVQAVLRIASSPSLPQTVMGYGTDDLMIVAWILRGHGISAYDIKRAADNFTEASRIIKLAVQAELDKRMQEYLSSFGTNGGIQ
jgi:hypothetical protein